MSAPRLLMPRPGSRPLQDEIDALLEGSSDDVRAVALKLIDAVRKAAPKDVHVAVKPGWQCVAFGVGPKMGQTVCEVIPHMQHVNLQLMHGASLNDPSGLLEGTGKAVRHVKVRTAKDAAQKAVKELVKAGAFPNRGGVAGAESAMPRAHRRHGLNGAPSGLRKLRHRPPGRTRHNRGMHPSGRGL